MSGRHTCCSQPSSASLTRRSGRGTGTSVGRLSVQEYETVIRPAVSGVENVLRAVDESPSVERVVMTSSVGAVVGHHWERGRDHVYTEADWNQTATETFLPYHRRVPGICRSPC